MRLRYLGGAVVIRRRGVRGLQQDANGFTVFPESSDTRKIYVSTSGNDANDGLTDSTPKLTIAAGLALLRDGYPDWLLLKKGDTWTTPMTWPTGGRSALAPQILGAYGSGARPKVQHATAVNTWVRTAGKNYLALVGVHLVGHGGNFSRAVGDDNYGIRWTGGGSSLHVEDCKVEGHATNLGIEGAIVGNDVTVAMDGVTIRRCVIVDSYRGPVPLSSQGIFCAGCSNLLIEENVLDHNGWHESLGDAEATSFNHNMYLTRHNTYATVRNNISARAAAWGCQGRCGGYVTGNLFLNNSFGAFISSNNSGGNVPRFLGSTMNDNVVLDGKWVDDSAAPEDLEGREGLIVEIDAPTGVTVARNVISNGLVNVPGLGLGIKNKGAAVAGNFIDNWNIDDNIAAWWTDSDASTWVGMTFTDNTISLASDTASRISRTTATSLPAGALTCSGNQYYARGASNVWFRIGSTTMDFATWATYVGEVGSATGTVSIDHRNAARYNSEVLLGDETNAAFLTACRAQSKDNWDSRLLASAVNTWIKAGYGL